MIGSMVLVVLMMVFSAIALGILWLLIEDTANYRIKPARRYPAETNNGVAGEPDDDPLAHDS